VYRRVVCVVVLCAVFDFFINVVECISRSWTPYTEMELDINNLCNVLNILVKPADKGEYIENVGSLCR